jgi:hypothetical protein
VICKQYGKCRASRQVLTDINCAVVARLARAQLRQECPEQSDAEIDETIFSAILDLMGDPAWESVQ